MGSAGTMPVGTGQPWKWIAKACGARFDPIPMRAFTTTFVDVLHSTEFRFRMAMADLQLWKKRTSDRELNTISRRRRVGNPRRTAVASLIVPRLIHRR